MHIGALDDFPRSAKKNAKTKEALVVQAIWPETRDSVRNTNGDFLSADVEYWRCQKEVRFAVIWFPAIILFS